MLLSTAFLVTSLVSLQSAQVLSGVVEDKYSCPHGWTRYGSKKCLKYVNELQDYDRAQATCRSKNQGTLVTVHSHEEQNFVYSYIHSIAASSTPIWLGAKQIDFESILWLDKTENSYVNWAPSEPSHPDEICIAINPRNGQWHDVMCTEANVPACERAPTTQWPFFVAFCSEGWFQFNDEKCVRIISSQALNFYESQELCRSKYNSKLLSIKTDKESEFIHNLIKFRDVKLPVWLGAVQNDFSSFNWIDKSDVTFTNWAEGEPNDPDHACISMVASGGKWSDNDCKEQKLILCQKVPEEGACETGWLQFRQDKCYRFVHIRLAFDDAESLCNNLYGGHLPSIHSQEEQFMISQFLASVNVKNGSEIWLGGRQMDFHNFNWGDGSLFNYSYWEPGEPSFPAEKCIEMSWRNGRWNDINCRLKRAVLCERQVTSRHHVKPILYQPTTCLDSNCTGNAAQGSASNAQSPLSSSSGSAGEIGSSGTGTVLQASPGAVDVDRESNSNSSATSLNGTASASDPANSFMIPLDDKPIRVITSIMNREQQQLLPPPSPPPPAQHPPLVIEHQQQQQAPVTNGSFVSHPVQPMLDTINGSLSIHYNSPQPEKVLSANNSQPLIATVTEPAPVQNGSSLSMAARRDSNQAPVEQQQILAASKDTKPATVAAASQEAVNQLTMAQQEEQTTVSLLDKIKAHQGATIATTPARSVSQPMTTDTVNTTALGAPKATSPQAMPPAAGVAPTVPQAVAPLDNQRHLTNNSESHAAAPPALADSESQQASSSSTGTNMNISTAQEFAQVTSLSTPSGQQRERINPNDGQSFNQEISVAQ